MTKLEETLKRQLDEQRQLTRERDDNIETLLKDLRNAAENYAAEHSAHTKKSLDWCVEVEKNVNLRAERDALLLALVAAYKTRKP